MAKSVLLPFCKPIFATVQQSAAVGLGINGHPTAYNGVLNQLTSLMCTTRFLRGYTSPEVSIPEAHVTYFDFFERYIVSSRFGTEFFEDVIKRMLDEGYYVYFTGVDDYYVPGKSWYRKRHMTHDGILCGYDDNDETFSIASYNVNWIFSMYRVPKKCFFEGLQASCGYKQCGSLIAYKMKDDMTISLDPHKILERIKQYLSVTIDKVPLDRDDSVVGIAVHDLLSMYMDRLKDGSIPSTRMDWRALRPVWEHKRCMLDRLHAIEEMYGWDSEISSEYAPLVDQANRLRGLYAMYHKNRRRGLLDAIGRGLVELREKENEILQIFVERMEETLS